MEAHMAKVAFLGLGVMGYPMAGHLKNKGGHEVTVYNRTAAKAEKWVAQYGGGRAGPAPTPPPSDELLLCCVGDGQELVGVARGRNGALLGLEERGVCVADPPAPT